MSPKFPVGVTKRMMSLEGSKEAERMSEKKEAK